MNCPEWEERIALYSDGDLSPDDLAETKRHLDQCAPCREFAEGIAHSLAIARAAHAEAISPAAFTALRARVLEQIARGRRPSRRLAWIVPSFAAAVLAFVLLVPRPVEFLRGAGDSHRQQSRRHDGSTSTPPPAPLLEPVAPAATQPFTPNRPPRARRRPKPRPPAEPFMVKLITDDPDVVIYWIPN